MILSLLFLTIIINQSVGCQLELIAAYGIMDGGTELISRSAATYGKTVRFFEVGQSVGWNFTTYSSCNLDVLNVVYSNDGPADNLTLYLDQDYIGSFQSIEHTNVGVFWNKMVDSGLVGKTNLLTEGNHTLKLLVTVVDIHGVEIDKIVVGVLCGSEGACLVKIYGEPNESQIRSESQQDEERWNRGNIISLAVGLTSTVISIIIAIPAFIAAVWSIYKCANGGELRKKLTVRISKLKEPLIDHE